MGIANLHSCEDAPASPTSGRWTTADRRETDVLAQPGRFSEVASVWLHPVRWPLAIIAVATLLFVIPGRTEIAPLVSSDNAYIFMAADRLFAGFGLTSIPPHAPLQPWEWQADWTQLTKWPPAYPMLLCLVRGVTGMGTVAAAQLLSVVACATALVGWFAWFRRTLPGNLSGVLLGLVGAGSAVSVEALINPSTDTLIVALVPWLMIGTNKLVQRRTLTSGLGCPVLSEGKGGGRIQDMKGSGKPPSPTLRCAKNGAPGIRSLSCDKALAARSRSHAASAWSLLGWGMVVGGLFWIRYAGIFVAAGIGLHLLLAWRPRKQLNLLPVAAFAVGALMAPAALLILHQLTGSGGGVHEQLNLGGQVGFDFSASMFATAWWLWTDLPFYAYKWYGHGFFAIGVPLVVVAFCLMTRYGRGEFLSFIERPTVQLSATMVVALLAMVIVATTFFHGKYDYVGLERYYRPIKPLYFVLLVGPLLTVRFLPIRAAFCVAMVMACEWFVQQEWPRPYRRWLAAERPFTPYGRWARSFSPDSGALYEWLKRQHANDLVIFSNFQDDIALETWIPALPLPRTRVEMDRWIARLQESRRIDTVRVLFVIDPDNGHRDYFLPSREETVATLDLEPASGVPAQLARFVLRPRTPAEADAEAQLARAATPIE